jgi:hypothetical protein
VAGNCRAIVKLTADDAGRRDMHLGGHEAHRLEHGEMR